VLDLVNTTPFRVSLNVIPDGHGDDVVVVAAKVTLRLGRQLEWTEEQQPLVEADEYWGEAGASSLKHSGELGLPKPATNVVLIGHAWPANGKKVTSIDVSVSAGRLKKTVRVFGDRCWSATALGTTMTDPLPFESMPLVFERAYGGSRALEDGTEVVERRNPIGAGFLGGDRGRRIDGVRLPNLEEPRALIRGPKDQPPPACFGAVAPAWSPRLEYAGTYDEKWREARAPLLPDDFDPRYFNIAAPELTTSGHFAGKEPFTIIGASKHGRLEFVLPSWDLAARFFVGREIEAPPFVLDSVVINPDDERICLLWKAERACRGELFKVKRVEVHLRDFTLNGTTAES
jgi:hypothetical protein